MPLEFFLDKPGPDAQRILKAFPKATILAAMLESTVDGWGYALWEKGSLIRASTGDNRIGETFGFGAPLDEEAPLFKWSTVHEGKRIFYDKGRLVKHEHMGEELVFRLLVRVFGKRVDMGTIQDPPFPVEELQVERFVWHKPE